MEKPRSIEVEWKEKNEKVFDVGMEIEKRMRVYD